MFSVQTMTKRSIFFILLFCVTFTCLAFNVKLCFLHSNKNEIISSHNRDNYIPETDLNGIYIYLDKDDYKDLKNKRTLFHRVLYTNDSLVINEFIKNSEFRQTGGDICTCTSFIYFTRNDTIQEEYECCISSKKLCLQSSKWGYLEATSDSTLKLIEHFKDKVGVVFK